MVSVSDQLGSAIATIVDGRIDDFPNPKKAHLVVRSISMQKRTPRELTEYLDKWLASPIWKSLWDLRNSSRHRYYRKSHENGSWLITDPSESYAEHSELGAYADAAIHHAQELHKMLTGIRELAADLDTGLTKATVAPPSHVCDQARSSVTSAAPRPVPLLDGYRSPHLVSEAEHDHGSIDQDLPGGRNARGASHR